MEADGTGKGVEETTRLELIGQQVDEASVSPSSHVHSRSRMDVAVGHAYKLPLFFLEHSTGCHLQSSTKHSAFSFYLGSSSNYNSITSQAKIQTAFPTMKSSTIIASLAVAAGVSAAPAGFQNSTGITWTPAPSDQTTCDPSSFAQAPVSDAADWRFCAALSSAWSSTNGTFNIHDLSGSSYMPVLKQEGCTLGVKASEQGQGPYTMGDQDIKAILRIALQNYSDGTELSVEGNVKCNVATGGRAGLKWQIYGQ
ncbi:hypothetical protein MKX08_000068 [Trichoderma sp. CBMAI-0020]|nr:hypothetical protein MKX08_000068 [Trichoderma sp. CBMAI-0020]WOD45871.1 hypothetical protein [Trichoderma atroviride]